MPHFNILSTFLTFTSCLKLSIIQQMLTIQQLTNYKELLASKEQRIDIPRDPAPIDHNVHMKSTRFNKETPHAQWHCHHSHV